MLRCFRVNDITRVRRPAVIVMVILASVVGAFPAWAADPQDLSPSSMYSAEQTLMASDSFIGNHFGTSLSISVSGNTAIVGAAGAAYIFERATSLSDWAEVRRLTPSDASAGNAFGRSVDVGGDLAIVGAPGGSCLTTPTPGTCTQSKNFAFIFERNSGGPNAWGEIAKLTAPGGRFDAFGDAVAVGGSGVLVSSPFTFQVTLFGAVFDYQRGLGGPNVWGVRNVLRAPPSTIPDTSDSFGATLAASGSTIIAGGVKPFGLITGKQEAYVFEATATGGFQRVATLTALQAEGFRPPAPRVALNGDNALIGTGNADLNGPSVYLFRRNQGGPGAWGNVRRLEWNEGHFPASVSINSETAVVEATVFRRNQGTTGGWGQVNILADPNRSALGGDSVFVAALSSDGIAEPGAVGVFVSDYDHDGIRDGADSCVLDPENNVAFHCQRSGDYALLDGDVAMSGMSTKVTGNVMSVTATFTNHIAGGVRNPFFIVNKLTEGNLVTNLDGGLEAGAGGTLTPDVGDGVWQEGEPATVTFVVRLATRNPFRFVINVMGDTTP